MKVSLEGNGEPSGLAMMLFQYFEQNLGDCEYKRRQACRIRGKMAIEASEGNIGVTVQFKGDSIEISSGCFPNADLSMRGGIFDIAEAASSGSGKAIEKIMSGKLKIESAWRHPLFAFRVARFMSLPAEMRADDKPATWPVGWMLAAAGAAVILGMAALLALR
ncbi:MAG: hypothetical protein C4520_02085 [Candidatus Abyssobacteria bacterium SURF_5]|uniref:SCP2 domain-containing protein n=1 Tax=Abyssobacteria bacterium (strain SURF_5) TaxID=2093360 RepID=A0A3A4P4E0_ABYX5|nr:MAG: hypothetical protein C4520_02085 [Candidatus Abyssubacteria bacterium SURF_5]